MWPLVAISASLLSFSNPGSTDLSFIPLPSHIVPTLSFAAHMFKKVSSIANAPLTISPKLKKARFFHQCISYLSNNLTLSSNIVNRPAIPSSVLSSPVVCVCVHLCFYLLPLLRVIDNLSTHITISTSTSIAVPSRFQPLLIPLSCPVSLLIHIL